MRGLFCLDEIMNKDWFAKEIATALSDGVTHIENQPFLLLPKQSNHCAVILIHGFSSSPREMRELGEILQQHGFTVYGPRLPGHGTSPQDLAARPLQEWRATVLSGFDALAAAGLKVSAAGLSTGALLSLDLALQRPLEKILLLSPFLRLKHWLSPYVGLLKLFVRYQNKEIPAAEQPFYYRQRPLQGIVQIGRLLRHLKPRLPLITTPVLVLAASGDATIAPGTAQQLFKRLGSPKKAIHLYGDEVPHVLTGPDNPCRQEVLTRCVDFLTNNPAPGSA